MVFNTHYAFCVLWFTMHFPCHIALTFCLCCLNSNILWLGRACLSQASSLNYLYFLVLAVAMTRNYIRNTDQMSWEEKRLIYLPSKHRIQNSERDLQYICPFLRQGELYPYHCRQFLKSSRDGDSPASSPMGFWGAVTHSLRKLFSLFLPFRSINPVHHIETRLLPFSLCQWRGALSSGTGPNIF